MQKHFGTWEIIRSLAATVPWPYPDGAAQSFIDDVLLPGIVDGSKMAWAIVEKHGDDELIGLLEYRPRAQDNRGFWLAGEFHGIGYMTEAVTAFQDYIFFELGVESISVLNQLANARSRRVKEKTAARLVGTVSMAHHSGSSETQKWIVTREAWAAARGRTL